MREKYDPIDVWKRIIMKSKISHMPLCETALIETCIIMLLNSLVRSGPYF